MPEWFYRPALKRKRRQMKEIENIQTSYVIICILSYQTTKNVLSTVCIIEANRKAISAIYGWIIKTYLIDIYFIFVAIWHVNSCVRSASIASQVLPVLHPILSILP